MDKDASADLPPEEIERREHTRVVRRIVSREQQNSDTLMYWQSRTPDERAILNG